MDVRSFSFITGIACGPNGNISPDCKWLPIRSCNGNIISHLRNLHVSVSSITSEAELILVRSGFFEDSNDIDDHIICPNHRFHLGKGFRGSKLCMAKEPLPNCNQKHKASNTTISRAQSEQIHKQHGTLIPIGAGFCRQCRVGLCNSLKSQLKVADHETFQETKDNPLTIQTEDNPLTIQTEDNPLTIQTEDDPLPKSNDNNIHTKTGLQLYEINKESCIPRAQETDEEFNETTETRLEYQTSEYGLSQASGSLWTQTASQGDSNSWTTEYELSQASGSLWTPTASQEIDSNSLKRKALDNFLTVCDASPIKKTLTSDWENSSKRTKKDYITKAQKICFQVLDVLAPGQGHHLLEALVKTEESKEYDLLAEVTEAYKLCCDWGTQCQILSLVANKVTYEKLKALIPNLSHFKFSAARKHALSYGQGQKVPSPDLSREGTTTAQISHFLDFVTSPAIITDMPYGETKLKLSSGETIHVPKVILNSVRTRVIEQYSSYCEETGYENIASLSTYMRILHSIGPNVRKSMKGLDNYAAAGAKAFESLQKVVELFSTLGKGNEWKEGITRILAVSKQYLKLEYKMHVTKDSEVADHCCTYALSDGTKDYSSPCTHSHTKSCKQCEDLETVLVTLTDLSSTIDYENDDQRDDTIYIVSESVRAVQEWKKHILRTVNQDMARKTILEDLQSNQVLIERDCAMKFIPMQYRESQSSWYGKRGLNWHVTVATFKMEDKLQTHTILHVFDSAAQDADTSNAVLSDSLDMLHQLKPCLDSAFIRSDNAGCFHGTVSICASPYLSSSIFCSRVDFADPQGGKSICDRKAAHTKSFITRHVNKGNDVCTSSDFKNAIMASKMKNVSVVVALPPSKDTSKKQPAVFKLPKITLLNNFAFNQDGNVRVWRQYNIGEGCVVPCTTACISALPKLTIIDSYQNKSQFELEEIQAQPCVPASIEPLQTTYSPLSEINDGSQSESGCSPELSVDIIAAEDTAGLSELFSCAECTKTFKRYGNLLRHLDHGSHVIKSVKQCLTDKAKMEYSKQMDKVNLTATNLQNVTSGTGVRITNLKQGWALKLRREVKRFNKNQTNYLDEKFDRGEKTGQKCDPEEVSQDMRQIKDRNGQRRFKQGEFLSSLQIASYFSRLVVRKRQSYNPLYTEEDLQAETAAQEFQELNELAASDKEN